MAKLLTGAVLNQIHRAVKHLIFHPGDEKLLRSSNKATASAAERRARRPVLKSCLKHRGYAAAEYLCPTLLCKTAVRNHMEFISRRIKVITDNPAPAQTAIFARIGLVWDPRASGAAPYRSHRRDRQKRNHVPNKL